MLEQDEPARLLNTADVAAMLGVSKRTVEKWVSQKRIPFVKLGTAGVDPCCGSGPIRSMRGLQRRR